MHKITLKLYGTSGCHLCEQAQEVISSATTQVSNTCTVNLSQLDIMDDDSLYALYETRIPVLTIENGRTSTLLNWPFDCLQIEEGINSMIK